MEFGGIKMKKKIIKIVLPVILGALGGYLYYYFIGCNGSCAISGRPENSTAYGIMIGLILTDWKTIKSIINKGDKR